MFITPRKIVLVVLSALVLAGAVLVMVKWLQATSPTESEFTANQEQVQTFQATHTTPPTPSNHWSMDGRAILVLAGLFIGIILSYALWPRKNDLQYVGTYSDLKHRLLLEKNRRPVIKRKLGH